MCVTPTFRQADLLVCVTPTFRQADLLMCVTPTFRQADLLMCVTPTFRQADLLVCVTPTFRQADLLLTLVTLVEFILVAGRVIRCLTTSLANSLPGNWTSCSYNRKSEGCPVSKQEAWTN